MIFLIWQGVRIGLCSECKQKQSSLKNHEVYKIVQKKQKSIEKIQNIYYNTDSIEFKIVYKN